MENHGKYWLDLCLFPCQGYTLCPLAELCLFQQNFPPTVMVDRKRYDISEVTALCIYDWTLAFFQTVCPGQISWQILPNLASLIRFHPSRQLQWPPPAPKIWEAEWWSGVKNMVTLTRNLLSLQAVQLAQSAIFCNISSYTVNPLIHSVNTLGGHKYFITLMLLFLTGYCRGNTVSIWMRSRQNSERIRE